MDCPQITVEQGVLQGKVAKTPSGRTYYSYEGIPYAKPPLGNLRFRDPQPPEPWTGIRDATKPGNKCAQSNPYAPKFVGSEDCLFLNVYTPCLPSELLEKLPVIFFVHGGRLIIGFGDYHRPEYFLEQDVIFVTVNYRLNVLGFLALDIPEAPGNAGLKDATFALKWVNQNIASFGGDSNNITVMGESAGSGVVNSFLISKLAEGLFHKGIFESATCLSDLFMEGDHIANARDYVSVLGKDLKDPREIYEYLLTVPVEELMDAVCVSELNKEDINAYFLPIVEKKFDGVVPFFTEYPYVSFKENRFAKVPILSGIHTHEGALFLPQDFEGNLMFRNDLSFFIPRYLSIDPKSDMAKKMAVSLKEFYFADREIGKETLKEYVELLTDAYFLRDMYMLWDCVAKYQDEIYCYRFSYNGNMNTRIMKNLGLEGTSHGDIICYQFYRDNKAKSMTIDDERIVRFLSEVWSNFAKHGKPSWTDQKMGWLPYTKGERYLLNIGTELKLTVYPERERIDAWRNIMTPRSKM